MTKIVYALGFTGEKNANIRHKLHKKAQVVVCISALSLFSHHDLAATVAENQYDIFSKMSITC